MIIDNDLNKVTTPLNTIASAHLKFDDGADEMFVFSSINKKQAYKIK